MSALVCPSEDELALLAILWDESGIDLTEFAFEDPSQPHGRSRLRDYQWCLGGETVVLTNRGRFPISTLVGRQTVLTTSPGEIRGEWVEAEIKSFGRQELYEIELVRRGVRKTIRATGDHRWFASANRDAGRRRYEVFKTKDLAIGAFLAPVDAPLRDLRLDRAAVQAGIVWGDGTCVRANRTSLVDLYGDKRALAPWFDRPGRPRRQVGTEVPCLQISSLPYEYKDRPAEPTDSIPVCWGWLAGYFATDGSILPDGTCQITSVSLESISRVRDIASVLGIKTSYLRQERVSRPPGAVTDRDVVIHRATLRISDLPVEFFLHPTHRERRMSFEGRRQRKTDSWKVESVRSTGIVEEVFCAVVPETHAFALDDDILTGNCYMNDSSPQQTDLSARDVGKSFSISVRAAAFPFSYPGEHMLLAAPELNHLSPLTQAVEERLDGCRMLREMRTQTHGRGIKRAPHWQCTFLNGAMIFSRLPGHEGKGFKGMHVVKLEVDEGQELSEAAFIELEPTLKRGTPGASWRVHGVTRGARDTFDKLAENPEWTVHRIMAMHRPTWCDAERKSKESIYGGSSVSMDYRRNIYGEPGDATNPLFVLARLIGCIDMNDASFYNTSVYTSIKLEHETLDEDPQALQMAVMNKLNGIHKAQWDLAPKGYSAYYAGMDIGATIDPTEILIYGQRAGIQKEQLDLLLRIRLLRIPLEDQGDLVEFLLNWYGSKLVSWGMDRSGLGFEMYQRLHRKFGDRIQGFNFAAKYAVDLEERELKMKEKLSDLAIDRPFIEFASDALRDVVDAKGFLMPADNEILSEWRGNSYFVVKSSGGPYGTRKQYSTSSCHTLDAGRVMIAGKRLQGLHKLLADQAPPAPVIDVFMGGEWG